MEELRSQDLEELLQELAEECGAPDPIPLRVRVCPKCGKHNSESAWHCCECGTTLSIETLTDKEAAQTAENKSPDASEEKQRTLEEGRIAAQYPMEGATLSRADDGSLRIQRRNAGSSCALVLFGLLLLGGVVGFIYGLVMVLTGARGFLDEIGKLVSLGGLLLFLGVFIALAMRTLLRSMQSPPVHLDVGSQTVKIGAASSLRETPFSRVSEVSVRISKRGQLGRLFVSEMMGLELMDIDLILDDGEEIPLGIVFGPSGKAGARAAEIAQLVAEATGAPWDTSERPASEGRTEAFQPRPLGDEAVSDAGEPPGPDAERLWQEMIEEYGPPAAPLPDSASGEAADEAVPEPLHTDVLQQVHDAQPATPGPASSPAADRKGVAAIADNKVVAAILRTTIGRVIVGAIVGAILGLAVALPNVDESRPRHRPADYDAVVSFVIGFAVLGAFMGAFHRLKSSRFRRLADPRVGSGIAGAIVGATVGAWIALPSKAGGPIDVPELVTWVLGGALVGAVVGIVVYSRRARQG